MKHIKEVLKKLIEHKYYVIDVMEDEVLLEIHANNFEDALKIAKIKLKYILISLSEKEISEMFETGDLDIVLDK